jgi:hypothetical protein
MLYGRTATNMSFAAFCGLLLVAVVIVVYAWTALQAKLPDGPSGLPFVGVPVDRKIKLHEHLASFVPKFGDFFSLNINGERMVVLSSPAAVEELHIKRGSTYASRPYGSAQQQIVGKGRLVLLPHGDQFRVYSPASLLSSTAYRCLCTSETHPFPHGHA